MSLRPIIVTAEAPFFGEPCALCQERFGEGDHVVRCPKDRVTHHAACWRANNNECVALGCNGHGRINGRPEAYNPENHQEHEEEPIQLVEGEILEAAQAHEERIENWHSTKRQVRWRSCIGIALFVTLFSCLLICGSTYLAGNVLVTEVTNFINSFTTTPIPFPTISP